jgi:hypothetical protein
MPSPELIPKTLLGYLVISWLLRSARNAKARRTANALVFDATTTAKAMMFAATGAFCAASIYSASSDAFVPTIFFAVLTAISCFALPSTVLVDQRGVGAQHWWGHKVQIPWTYVQRVEYRPRSSTTVVVANNGQKITHSGLHRDSDGFREACERLTHKAIHVTI